MNHSQDTNQPTEPQTTPNARPSNLRSRWERKDTTSSSKTAPVACGEIDPSSVKEKLTHEANRAKPLHHKKPVAVSDSCTLDHSSTQKDHPQEAGEEIASLTHTPKPKYPRTPAAKTQHNSPSGHKPKLDKSQLRPKEKTLTAHNPVTYRPSSLPKETLWSRIQGWISSIFNPQSNYTPNKDKSDYQHKPAASNQHRFSKPKNDFNKRPRRNRSKSKDSSEG